MESKIVADNNLSAQIGPQSEQSLTMLVIILTKLKSQELYFKKS